MTVKRWRKRLLADTLKPAALKVAATYQPNDDLPTFPEWKERIEAVRSIIPIMPGVESTLAPIVPPTSVTTRSSTRNSSVRSMPGSSAIG